MDRGRRLWLLLPAEARELPADLALVLAGTVATVCVVITPVINETPLRILFGLPFVLFLPGYAFIAALFPERGESPANEEEHNSGLRDRGIDGIERTALSFGLSIAIVPLIGLVLNFTPWGITLTPILLSVSGFTVACTLVAYHRRRQLPTAERFSVPFDEWLAAGIDEVRNPDDRMDAALNVLLALSILLAVGSVGYAIAVPSPGEQFTEFYILTEDGEGGFVAADYPTEFVEGTGEELVIGIENHEHESVNYTVVIQLERVSGVGNESTVDERSELDRFTVDLDHGQAWNETITVTPDMTGEELRLQFLLYEDEVPPQTNRETAYRDLHLWIDVEPS